MAYGVLSTTLAVPPSCVGVLIYRSFLLHVNPLGRNELYYGPPSYRRLVWQQEGPSCIGRHSLLAVQILLQRLLDDRYGWMRLGIVSSPTLWQQS